MRIAITIFLISLCAQLCAQVPTRKVVTNDYPKSKETFYLLKSDGITKQGKYTQKHGGLSTLGQFENNKKVGIWEYYDRHGELEQKIDFTNDTVLFAKPFKSIIKCWMFDGDSLKEVELTNPPLFMGGGSAINTYYFMYVRYPAEGVKNNVQGTVLISATITKEGKIIDEKIEEGPGYGLNEEALRVIKLLPDEWIPGKINGQACDIRILIPLKFKLV